jgi:hypothetical protein
MSFWNYIGEFFFFRWLFGRFRKFTTEHDTHAESIGTSIGRYSECVNDNHDEGIVPDGVATPVIDNALDYSDNSETLMIWIDSCEITMVIIIPIYISKIIALIIV